MIGKMLWLLASLCGLLGISTVGSAAPVTASLQDYTSGGGVSTMAIPAATAAAVLVSGAPGRLQSVLVTSLVAASWTFYDTTNTSSQSGATIIGFVAASTAIGGLVRFQMPALKGIVAVPSAAGPAITVAFN
jgi:hypothetical protein